MPVEFKDFSISVKSEMQDAAVKWLIEAAGELESQTKGEIPVLIPVKQKVHGNMLWMKENLKRL